MVIQLTSAATVAIPAPEHRVDGVVIYKITPGSAITFTFAPDGLPGQQYELHVQATGTSRVLTFGTGFTSTGTLASGTDDTKMFVVCFTSDGQTYRETSRTAAQA